MAASVTVHHMAFSERRFELLAKLLAVDVDSASFKMARLWSAMTELQTDIPPVEVIRACLLDELGEDKLVRSALAERLADGRVRVRGRYDNDTGKDRLEWYAEMQDRQVRAGRARAASAPRDRRGRLVAGSVQPAPACPASDLNSLSPDLHTPELPDPDLDPPGDRDREGPQLTLVQPPHEPVDLALSNPGPTRTLSREDLRRRLFVEAWQFAGQQFVELQSEGIEPNARNTWVAMPDAKSYDARELFARIDERLIADPPNIELVRDSLRNRILVAAAEARTPKHRHLRFMTPARMWDGKSFSIASALTPEQVVAAARSSPDASRRGPPPEPARQITDLSKR